MAMFLVFPNPSDLLRNFSRWINICLLESVDHDIFQHFRFPVEILVIDWLWLRGWLINNRTICTRIALLFWNFISLFEKPRTRLVGKIRSQNQSIGKCAIFEFYSNFPAAARQLRFDAPAFLVRFLGFLSASLRSFESSCPATWWLWLQLMRLLRCRSQQGEVAIQRAHLLALQSLQGYFCYKAICAQCKALGVAGGGSQVCKHQVRLSYCRQGSPRAKRRPGFLATRVLPGAIGHSILRTSVKPLSHSRDPELVLYLLNSWKIKFPRF